jgi:hypothetical protein
MPEIAPKLLPSPYVAELFSSDAVSLKGRCTHRGRAMLATLVMAG